MKPDKIGLCVCYDTKNFGSQLQVLATVKKIEALGYSTEIIRYYKKLTPGFIVCSLPRLLNYCFVHEKLTRLKKKWALAVHPEVKKGVQIRNRRFEKFVTDFFPNLSVPYKGWKELQEQSKKNYKGFLCGSDQLWLPGNLGSHFYTLEFAPKECSRIAYATSFGMEKIPWYQKRRTRRYLKCFNVLSTRESQGVQIIWKLTGKKVPIVCDPTLLFTSKEWEELIPLNNKEKVPYIFCYYLGKNPKHRCIARELQKKTGLPIITIPFLDNFVEGDQDFGDKRLFDIDAGDFVNLIRNAKYVLTDSFHGSVFSILNHKQFVVFSRFRERSRNSRNSRIDSLCTVLCLEDRRYCGEIYTQISKEIDYEAVEQKLRVFRRYSKSYLINALKTIEPN